MRYFSKISIIILSFLTIFFYVSNVFATSSNIVTNPGAETADLSGWTIEQNWGSGWAAGVFANTGSYSFISSYQWDKMSQELDLHNIIGYTNDYLDTAPIIDVGTYVNSFWANNSPSDSYQFFVQLRRADHSVIATYNTGTVSIAKGNWQQISHQFSGYGSGLRYVYIQLSGIDNGSWGGQYGAAFDDTFVTLPDEPTLSPITLTYGASGDGYISGITTQKYVGGVTGSSVTATPNYGSYFVNWSDNSTNPTRTDNVAVDTTLTAYFALVIKPGAPTNLQISGSSMQPLLTWDAPGASGNGSYLDYQIQYKSSGESWDTILGSNNVSGTSYTYYLDRYNANLIFRVVAYNESGQGPPSNEVAYTTPAGPPNAVDFFGSGRGNGGSNWEDNNGDNTNTSFNTPSGIALDTNHHRLFVADGGGDGSWNNRIMIFNLNSDNTPIDHIADAIIYQVNVNGSSSSLNQPRNVLYDNTTNHLYIGDSSNGRVIVIDASSDFVTDGNADDPATVPTVLNILGAGDFYYPLGMTLDSINGRLFVAEKDKSKGSTYGSINVFDVRSPDSSPVTMCGVTTTGISNTGPSCTLWIENAYAPRDIAYNPTQQLLYVAFSDQGRVLVADVRPEGSNEKSLCSVTTTGLPQNDNTALIPSCVLGQINLSSTGTDTTQNTFNVPRGLWYDSNFDKLYVADLQNERVLVFNTMSSLSNGMNASAVYGQIDYTSNNSSTYQYSFDSPNAVTVDSINKRLYVSDAWNNRVMVFNLGGTPINEGPTVEKFESDIAEGFISVDGNNATDTTKITFTTQYTVKAGDITIEFPEGTEMTKTGGGSIDFTAFTTIDNTLLKKDSLNGLVNSLKIGIPNFNLTFSKAVTISIPVGSSYEGKTLTVYYQAEGSSDWIKETTCKVVDGLCTFTTLHATTFAAGDTSNSSTSTSSNDNSSPSMPKAPTCNDAKPSNSPDFFQIDVTDAVATVYYVPVSNNVSNHYLSYSEKENEYMYGVETNQSKSDGVLSFTVNMLNPNKVYYFKVRGQNGCMPGEWSNQIKVKTNAKGYSTKKSFYKDAPFVETSAPASQLQPKKAVLGVGDSLKVAVPSSVPTQPKKHISSPAPEKKRQCLFLWCW